MTTSEGGPTGLAEGLSFERPGPRCRLAYAAGYSRALDVVDHVARIVIGSLLIVLGAVMGLQVISRQVLHLPVAWTQEVSLMCIVWLSFVGAAVGVRHHGHFVVNMAVELLRGAWRRWLLIVIYLAMSVVALTLLLYGWGFAAMGLDRLSPSLQISMIWTYLAVPTSALMMVLFLAERILDAAFPDGTDAGASSSR